MIIRSARPADAPQIAALWNRLIVKISITFTLEAKTIDVLETIIGADLFEFVEIFSDTEEVDSVSEEERLNMTQSITDPLTLAKAFVQKLAAGLPAPVGTTDPTHQMCTLSSLSSPDQFLL